MFKFDGFLATLVGIISAVLVAGAYPMVGRLLPPRKNARRAVLETASGAKVRLHPHSSNFNLSFNKSSGNPLMVFDEITRGDGGMYVKNCSVVGSYPLLLLATEIAVAPPDDVSDEDDEGSSGDEAGKSTLGQQKEEIMSSPDNTVSVVVDRWLRFDATALDVAQIYCLRERLASAILFKVRFSYLVITFSNLIWEQFSIVCSGFHLMSHKVSCIICQAYYRTYVQSILHSFSLFWSVQLFKILVSFCL